MKTCEVYLWGSIVGTIVEQDNRLYFEYSPSFLEKGVEISPLYMPLSSRVYSFPSLNNESFRGLPGVFADSLPDKYGNKVIDAWLRANGRDSSSFSVIDRLCYIGKRGMGALEYKPALKEDTNENEKIEFDQLVDFANKIFRSREEISIKKSSNQIGELFKISSSAGGARAKAIIAINEKTKEIKSGQIPNLTNHSYWVLKFDLSDEMDKTPYTLIEYAYAEMAKEAGINVAEHKLIEENGRHHFLSKRFDRDENGSKIFMASLGGLAHSDYNEPQTYGYEDAMPLMRALGIQRLYKNEYYRRMVFNVLARNQDDHVKNISFLMNKRGEWSLAPAYDLTYAHNPNGIYTSKHQMTINGKSAGITRNDLIESAKTMKINIKSANLIIDQVRTAIDKWSEIASNLGIEASIIDKIKKDFVLL